MRPSYSLLALGLLFAPRAEAETQNCGVSCHIEAFLGDVGSIFGDLTEGASAFFGMLEEWGTRAEEVLGVTSDVLTFVDAFVDSDGLGEFIDDVNELESDLGRINNGLGISEEESAAFSEEFEALRRAAESGDQQGAAAAAAAILAHAQNVQNGNYQRNKDGAGQGPLSRPEQGDVPVYSGPGYRGSHSTGPAYSGPSSQGQNQGPAYNGSSSQGQNQGPAYNGSSSNGSQNSSGPAYNGSSSNGSQNNNGAAYNGSHNGGQQSSSSSSSSSGGQNGQKPTYNGSSSQSGQGQNGDSPQGSGRNGTDVERTTDPYGD